MSTLYLDLGIDPESGDPWFAHHGSTHPRGYWTRQDKRLGVTQHDPARYRRYTLDQLQARGDADDTFNYRDTFDWLTADKTRAIEEQERGAALQRDDVIEAGSRAVTKHTILGRMRETKRAAYYRRRNDLADAMRAAGLSDAEVLDQLDQWDAGRELRIAADDAGGLAIERDGNTLAQFSRDDLERAQVAGTEHEAAWRLEQWETGQASKDDLDWLLEEGYIEAEEARAYEPIPF